MKTSNCHTVFIVIRRSSQPTAYLVEFRMDMHGSQRNYRSSLRPPAAFKVRYAQRAFEYKICFSNKELIPYFGLVQGGDKTLQQSRWIRNAQKYHVSSVIVRVCHFDDATGTGSRPNHSQLSNVTGTPQSQTVSSLGSHKYCRGSVDPALQLEWRMYSATGVTCDDMLTRLYPNAPSPSEATSKALRLRLAEALSMRPETVQYGPIADICNNILQEYEASNRPTEAQPSRLFVAQYWTAILPNKNPT